VSNVMRNYINLFRNEYEDIFGLMVRTQEIYNQITGWGPDTHNPESTTAHEIILQANTMRQGGWNSLTNGEKIECIASVARSAVALMRFMRNNRNDNLQHQIDAVNNDIIDWLRHHNQHTNIRDIVIPVFGDSDSDNDEFDDEYNNNPVYPRTGGRQKKTKKLRKSRKTKKHKRVAKKTGKHRRA